MRVRPAVHSLIGAAREGLHRRNRSAALVANEYHRAGIAFALLNRDERRAAEAPGYRARGVYERLTPIVLVPAAQLERLEFLTREMRARFLRDEIVDLPAQPPLRAGDYARDWVHRLEHEGCATVLPECVAHLTSLPRAREFVLAEPIQEFVIRKQLSTTLFNAVADVDIARRASIVRLLPLPIAVPFFLRLVSIDAEGFILRDHNQLAGVEP